MIALDLATLATVSGGAARGSAPQGGDDEEAPRTWKQMGKEYASACVTGAGEQLMFNGKPRSFKKAVGTAAMGCAMGVGMKAIEDGTNFVFGG